MTGPIEERSFWGVALVTWPAVALAGTAFSASDVVCLVGVGLPEDEEWNLEVVKVVDGLERRENPPVLAFDGPTPLCFEAGRGVVALEEEVRRFVNASVAAFGYFLMLYADYRRCVRGLSDAD